MGHRRARGKGRIHRLSVAACVAIAIGAGGCSLIRSFPETAHKEAVRERVLETESTLSAAGFSQVPIKSASEPDQVSSLPPLEIHYRIENGRFRYRFADPEFCNCVFEGDEAAYQRFERLRLAAEKERSDRQAGQVHREGAQQTALDSVSSKNPFRWNWF